MNSQQFLEMLHNLHSELDSIWPEGRTESCCENDGNHFTLKNYKRPVSIGQVEAYLIYNLVRLTKSAYILEIGTGFGYSSMWLAAAISRADNLDCWVKSIDDCSEGGIAKNGINFARHWSEIFGFDKILHFYEANSPEDISKIVSCPVNLVLIDGNHNNNQPCLDYLGVKPYLDQSSVLIWHDVLPMYDVNLGLAAAIKDGWYPITFPTSCRICVCYREVSGWETSVEAFSKAKELEFV